MRIIGIDGGGSKTHAYLVDQDLKILDEYFGPSSNYLSVGIDRVKDIIVEVCNKFNYDPDTIVSLGLAGLSRDRDIKVFHQLMKELNIKKYILNNDVYAALIGAFEGSDGSLLIAGTGSICYSVVNGKISRYGGHGHLIGDGGSGYNIGKNAINLAFETRDGIEDKVDLLDLVMNHYGIDDLDQLLYDIYNDFDKGRVASLTKTLLANTHIDGVKAILDREVLELIKLTNKLEINTRISLGGGLLTNENYYSNKVKEILRTKFELVQGRHNATMGACIIGLELEG